MSDSINETRGRKCTIPLWLVFALQSLVVMVSFIAVILVLVMQQQSQFKTAVFEKIDLHQQRSEYVITSPLVTRESRFKQLSEEFLLKPDMWYEDTMNQFSPALQRFYNFSYFLCRNDPLIHSVYQHLRHSSLTHSNGDPIYGVTGMNKDLITLQSHWDDSNLATVYVHPTYPLTYTISLVSPIPVSQDPFSLALRNITAPQWGLGTVLYNSITGETTVASGLAFPVIIDPVKKQSVLQFVYAFNVSYMTNTVDSALLSPQSKLLLFDHLSSSVATRGNLISMHHWLVNGP